MRTEALDGGGVPPERATARQQRSARPSPLLSGHRHPQSRETGTRNLRASGRRSLGSKGTEAIWLLSRLHQRGQGQGAPQRRGGAAVGVRSPGRGWESGGQPTTQEPDSPDCGGEREAQAPWRAGGWAGAGQLYRHRGLTPRPGLTPCRGLTSCRGLTPRPGLTPFTPCPEWSWRRVLFRLLPASAPHGSLPFRWEGVTCVSVAAQVTQAYLPCVLPSERLLLLVPVTLPTAP